MRLRLSVGALLLCAPLLSQLRPGQLIVTTTEIPVVPTSSTVQLIDHFASTSQLLPIMGFPASPATEGPDSIWVENPITMLLGTRIVGLDGNLYRAIFGIAGWTAALLNTGPMLTESVSQIQVIGSFIYVSGSVAGGTGGTTARVVRVPLAGGMPVLYADLGTAGALGLGNAMVAIGNVLHVFTFDSTTTGPSAEHWAVDTTTTPPLMTRVGVLPKSKLTPGTSNYGAVQAAYDDVTGLIVVAGVYGDVLWRTPAGMDVLQIYTVPTATSNLLDGLALDRDTGTVILGDRAAHIERVRSDGEAIDLDYLTVPGLGVAARVSNVAYVRASQRYLPNGKGCPQASGKTACNFVNSLPSAGNAGFRLTVDQAPAGALGALIIGAADPALDLTVLGAPGCILKNSLNVLLTTTVSPAGTASLGVPLPVGISGTVFTQWAVTDPTANQLGLVLSDARRMVVN